MESPLRAVARRLAPGETLTLIVQSEATLFPGAGSVAPTLAEIGGRIHLPLTAPGDLTRPDP